MGVGGEPMFGRGDNGFCEVGEVFGVKMDVFGMGGDEITGFANVGEGGDDGDWCGGWFGDDCFGGRFRGHS